MIERQLAAQKIRSESICFPHAQSVIRAERKTTHKKSGGEVSGVRNYLTSLELTSSSSSSSSSGNGNRKGSGCASHSLLAKLIRGHWSVENNIHWLRDAVGCEDRCRSRDPNAACALALLRTTLLAPLRAAGYNSLTQANELFAKNPAQALAILLNQRLAAPNL